MTNDEDEIRRLVATWMAATQSGDLETVLGLMADDVVFLTTGGKPMLGKAAFAEAARAMSGRAAPRFEGTSEIQEIRISGEWAFMWSKLTVVVTPPHGGEPVTRAGYTLSVLRRERGKWLLARDANMLAPTPA